MTSAEAAAPWRGRVARYGPALLGAVLRAGAVWAWLTPPTADGWSYLQRGINLLQTGVYGVRPGSPDATWPPLYSLLIATVAWMEQPLVGVAVLHVVCGALAVLLAGEVARELWGGRAGIAAGLLAALTPRLVLVPCLVLSENLFLPLVLLFAWLAVRALAPRAPAVRASGCPPAWRRAAVAGVAAGALALTRSVGYLLPWIWLPAALAAGKRWRTGAAELALVLLLQHAVLLPWGLRNLLVLDHFSLMTSTGGSDLFLGNNPHATGGWYFAAADVAKYAPEAKGLKGFERERALAAAARRWMARHPGVALRLYVRKLGLQFDADRVVADMIFEPQEQPEQLMQRTTASNPPPPDRPGGDAARVVLALGFYAAAALSLGGVALAVRRSRAEVPARVALAVLLGGALLLILPAAAFLGDPRFRWPGQDLLLPFAGLALASLAARVRDEAGVS